MSAIQFHSMAINMQDTPFIKQLASNDKPTRDKAVVSLRVYLSGKSNFVDLELLKLWKGLFYCMWMSDRPKTQHRLAIELANLVDVLREENVIPFLNAFWTTISREWIGIDLLRMDKFLFLVRQYLAASFRYLAKRDWQAGVLRECLTTLEKIPLNPKDSKIPNGLRYHMVDIYVDELEKVDASRVRQMPLDLLLEPLRRLGQESPTKAIRQRVKEALGDERLKNWNNREGEPPRPSSGDSGGEDEAEDANDEEWGGFDD